LPANERAADIRQQFQPWPPTSKQEQGRARNLIAKSSNDVTSAIANAKSGRDNREIARLQEELDSLTKLRTEIPAV
jgi:hypothetical protein